MSEQCGGCGTIEKPLQENGGCVDCNAELVRIDKENGEKVHAFNLLEAAENRQGGWSLSSLSYDSRAGLFKATMKRQPPQKGPRKPGKRRFSLEYESGYGSTRERAVIKVCENVSEDDGEVEVPVDVED